MKFTARLFNAQQGHTAMMALWTQIKPHLVAGHVLSLSVGDEGRSLEQNAVQWPYLEAFSQQLQWPVNCEMVTMAPEEWKDVLTAAFRGESVRLAKGLDGGVVMLGLRTSLFGKKEFSEWIDFLKATAALRGVTVNESETA